jgi:glycerate 2-kinase
VRKHLDALKGGRMAELAAPARVLGLVLSDVVGDPVEIIASGPLTPDPSTAQDALRILRDYMA